MIDNVSFPIYNINMQEIELPQPIDFEWDEFNIKKSRLKHGITPEEAEQAFFNENIVVFDERHSIEEDRYQMIGATGAGKVLFIAFTIRNKQIRIISARSASKKERAHYAKEFKENP